MVIFVGHEVAILFGYDSAKRGGKRWVEAAQWLSGKKTEGLRLLLIRAITGGEQEAGLLIICAVTGGDYAGDRPIISAATGGEQAVNRLIKEGFPAEAGTHLSTCSFDREAAPGLR